MQKNLVHLVFYGGNDLIASACGLLGLKESSAAAVSRADTQHGASGQIWAAAQE